MISIVIPVYNMEKHLDRCVNSCLKQTYRDYEIVLIDDGSTDKSAEICDRYVAENGNVKCLHQKNSGVASAKNAGIEIAKGDFLTFVDSDDYIDDNYLETLVSQIGDTDFIIGGLKFLMEDGISVYDEMKLDAMSFSRDQFHGMIWQLLDNDGLNFHVAKLYKKEIVDCYQIRFTDFRKTGGDDTVFNFDYLEHISRVSVISKNIYNYISYSSSTSHKYDEQKWERGKTLDSILHASCVRMDILSNEMQIALDKRICHLAFWVTSEIAAFHFSFSKKYGLIKKISFDDRFQVAYRNSSQSVLYEKQIERLYLHYICSYIFTRKRQIFNIKGKIYCLLPNPLLEIYRKFKKAISE